MNNTLDNSLEPNINTSVKETDNIFFNTSQNLFELCENGKNWDYSEIIKYLNSDKIIEKQLAVLELDKILSQNDAEALVSNLIGQDGKVREAVAFKINDLSLKSEYSIFFSNRKIFSILFQGIMDINGNVCRQIVNIIDDNSGFNKYLCEKLPTKINEILKTIESLNAEEKQYVVSKKNFQLYWCLEALYHIANCVDANKISNILLKTGEFYDYTIREKTAKILTKLDNFELYELKEKLKNDENYYVRRYLD